MWGCVTNRNATMGILTDIADALVGFVRRNPLTVLVILVLKKKKML